MNFLKRSTKYFLVLLSLISVLNVNAQEKNILERNISIKFSGEVLDPTYEFFQVIKLSTRAYLGAEYKLNSRSGIGLNFMYNSFKTHPYDVITRSPYQYVGDSMSMKKIGRTIGTGGEIYYKHFRKKKDAFYPIGSYFEFGLGLHNTRFTGYEFDYYNSQYDFDGNYITVLNEVREEERNIKTLSVVFRTGKQWVFDNNIFWGYGFSFRGHLPLSSMSDETEHYDTYSVRSLYLHEILLADWFTTHLSVGYIL